MSGPVPILLTCDIHTHTYPVPLVHDDVTRAREVLSALKTPCTFFFPAESAEALRSDVAGLMEEGHEIACHGLTHEAAEMYSTLTLDEQRRTLAQATERLEAVTGETVRSFRAPAFKISGRTMQALDELGYAADLSVVSQRLSVFGSDLYNMRPMLAPRRPYHPSTEDVFRRGAARIWEIPVSAWLLPFLSNTERLCGAALMRAFYHALRLESRVTGKPIVFMFHAEDFNDRREPDRLPRLSWIHFVPTKAYGLQFRYFLLERNWTRIRRDLVALLAHMAEDGSAEFLTARDYAARLAA